MPLFTPSSRQDYKATQRIAQDREAASLPRPSPVAARQAAGPPSSSAPLIDLESGRGAAAAAADEELERQALLQAQRQKETASLDNAIQFNSSLIEERDQGIQDIVRQVRRGGMQGGIGRAANGGREFGADNRHCDVGHSISRK